MDLPDEHPALARLLDRAVPRASPAERRAARESLTRLALILIRVETRMARDWHERHHGANPDRALE